MKERIRIGSRESKLAIIQAEIVKDMILSKYPGVNVEIVTMKTTGDMIQDKRLDLIGGKGLFTKELEMAQLEGSIDISVHSLKDMPMELSEELPIFAYTKREDPRDVLIWKNAENEIIDEGIIATSSRRREIQLRRLYPKSSIVPIRGNVQTRLKKLSEDPIDGTVLAIAGLNRLNIRNFNGRIFDTKEVVPAPGQGILAVQGVKNANGWLREVLNDFASETAAIAERQFIRVLDGGCSSPCAAYAEVRGNEILLTGLYYNENNDTHHVERKTGNINRSEAIGNELAREMLKKYG